MTTPKLSIGFFAGLGLALLGSTWVATGSVEATGARSHRPGDAPVGSGSRRAFLRKLNPLSMERISQGSWY